MALTTQEYDQLRHGLRQSLSRDHRFRTELTLIMTALDAGDTKAQARALQSLRQLLSIRAGEADPVDVEDLWPSDLVDLAVTAASDALRPVRIDPIEIPEW